MTVINNGANYPYLQACGYHLIYKAIRGKIYANLSYSRDQHCPS